MIVSRDADPQCGTTSGLPYARLARDSSADALAKSIHFDTESRNRSVFSSTPLLEVRIVMSAEITADLRPRFYAAVSDVVRKARTRVCRAVNVAMVDAYWNV